MSELLDVTKSEITSLYHDLNKLDRAWKSLLVICIAQYVCELCAISNKGSGVNKELVAKQYERCGLDNYVRRIISLRNDVCHRCGMKGTNENLIKVLNDSKLAELLSELNIINKKPIGFNPAAIMAGK